MSFIFQDISQTWRAAIILLGAVFLGLLLRVVVFFFIKRIAKKTTTVLDNRFSSRISGAFWLLLPLLFVSLSMSIHDITFPDKIVAGLQSLIRILYIVCFAWLLLGLINYFRDLFLQRYKLEVEDNLQARRMHTQVNLFRKISVIIIVVLALAAILLQFDKLRHIGTGILASAGLAGIVIGFAAQKTIANLLAGLQLAITQPISIDDVVVVENEWGRIEELTLTYVTVRIWDKRRLILPISYFIENPFQNWTRKSADIIGAVYLYVDYDAPVDVVRHQLHKILEESQHWDGKVWRLQVTDATEKTVQLRASMSASNSGSAWELRCEVREKMIEFIKTKYPDCLPRYRASLRPPER
jgi:small-conductance mechanosensitive channel